MYTVSVMHVCTLKQACSAVERLEDSTRKKQAWCKYLSEHWSWSLQETNSILDHIARATIDLFHQQSEIKLAGSCSPQEDAKWVQSL